MIVSCIFYMFFNKILNNVQTTVKDICLDLKIKNYIYQIICNTSVKHLQFFVQYLFYVNISTILNAGAHSLIRNIQQ